MMAVNADHYPFLLTSFQAMPHGEAEWRVLFEESAKVGQAAAQRDTYHVSISVTASAIGAAERAIVGALLKEQPAHVLERTVGSYVVMLDPTLRFVLTALQWIAPSFMRVEAAPNVGAAMKLANACLVARGIFVEPAAADGAHQWLLEQTEWVRQRTVPFNVT